jgi:predicted GTPase
LLKENVNNKRLSIFLDFKNNFTLFLVIAIAANKSDMYDLEEVEEEKVKECAKVYLYFIKEIGAIFKYTSAKNASGIDDLFESIGSTLLNLGIRTDMEQTVNQSITISKRKQNKTKDKEEKKKKKCGS